MIVSVNQPAYLPWLGYFHRIAVSDLHVVLDHVQFEKNSFVNRNRILTENGPAWLTVPVRTKGLFGALPISELEIETRQDWRTKHWRTLLQSYRKTPHFSAHAPFFEDTYCREWTHLAPLCEHMTTYLLKQFDIATPRVLSRTLAPVGKKSDLVLELCQKTHAHTYLSGILGRQYLVEADFVAQGIQILYQEYHHPRYPQQSSAIFYRNLSAVDLLFHCGADAFSILMDGQRQRA